MGGGGLYGSDEYAAQLWEVADGRRNGAGNLLVVFLRIFYDATFLRRVAQGQRLRAGEVGDHGEEEGGLVHVQADGESAVLRWVACEAGVRERRFFGFQCSVG